jgi:predicted GNAT family acetyltransferase
LAYPGVVGPDQTSQWFAQRAIELGVEFLEPIPQRIHSLVEKPTYPGAPGYARRTTAQDASILADWVTSFVRGATPHDPAPSRESLETIAGEGRHLLWIVNDEPVSMSAIVRRTRNAAAIALVYTPPSLRGRGYAGSVTAAVAEEAFAEGKTIACLYTDLRNPFSNRCYAKVGFKPVCDSTHFPRADFGRLIAVNIEKWGKVVQTTNVKADRGASGSDDTGLPVALAILRTVRERRRRAGASSGGRGLSRSPRRLGG